MHDNFVCGENNTGLNVSESHVTQDACAFTERVRYADLPAEALKIGSRCILDTLGLYVAGADEPSVGILIEEARDIGGRADALLIGAGAVKVPAPVAARVLGTAGHAHDWDDTQVSHDPVHVYGLLTHPSVPPLSAALAIAQRLGAVDGKRFILAFQTGFEVECKISEWMRDDHYRRGHHSSGTVGTFGAAVAAAKLLGLTGDTLKHAIGIAASFAAGIRCNFGTMTKPLHVGRAAENGVTAALLAARGFAADPEALDGRWGFAAVLAGGYDQRKLSEGFGRTWSIMSPGVSIKPYPSGILTHQAMDAMLSLVRAHNIVPERIAKVEFFAGKNIIEPIRYAFAENHLQAKFSMAALLSMIALYRRAGHREFDDAKIRSPEFVALQRKLRVINDPDIDAAGYDLIRSRIEVTTTGGDVLTQWADERYRGGPLKPFSDADLEEKFTVCTDARLDSEQRARVIEAVGRLASLEDAGELAEGICFNRSAPEKKRGRVAAAE
jgi:2-methylcitrate dehydratase PrpD